MFFFFFFFLIEISHHVSKFQIRCCFGFNNNNNNNKITNSIKSVRKCLQIFFSIILTNQKKKKAGC